MPLLAQHQPGNFLTGGNIFHGTCANHVVQFIGQNGAWLLGTQHIDHLAGEDFTSLDITRGAQAAALHNAERHAMASELQQLRALAALVNQQLVIGAQTQLQAQAQALSKRSRALALLAMDCGEETATGWRLSSTPPTEQWWADNPMRVEVSADCATVTVTKAPSLPQDGQAAEPAPTHEPGENVQPEPSRGSSVGIQEVVPG